MKKTKKLNPVLVSTIQKVKHLSTNSLHDRQRVLQVELETTEIAITRLGAELVDLRRARLTILAKMEGINVVFGSR